MGSAPTSLNNLMDDGGSRGGGGGHGHHRGGPFRPQRPVNHVNEANTAEHDDYLFPDELPEEIQQLLMDETYELDENYGEDCDVFCMDSLQV